MADSNIPGADAVDSYDDGRVAIDASGLTLRRYYFPTGGSKQIAFDAIRAVDRRPMGWLSGRGRGWGTTRPGYWMPLEFKRYAKRELIVVDLGGRVKPAFTPDDPETVERLLRAGMESVGR
jgi:hypothetical protein